jgi:hypothetical protein
MMPFIWSFLLAHVVVGTEPIVNLVPREVWLAPPDLSIRSGHYPDGIYKKKKLLLGTLLPKINSYLSSTSPVSVVYSDEVHGKTLRRIRDIVRAVSVYISQHESSNRRFLEAIEMVEWRWSIGILIDTAMENFSVWTRKEMGEYLTNTVPFVHCYFYAMFHLRANWHLDTPALQGYLLAVRYMSPRYVENSQWYLRVMEIDDESEFGFPIWAEEEESGDVSNILDAINDELWDIDLNQVESGLNLAKLLEYYFLSQRIDPPDLFPTRKQVCTRHSAFIRAIILNARRYRGVFPSALYPLVAPFLIRLCRDVELSVSFRMQLILPLHPVPGRNRTELSLPESSEGVLAAFGALNRFDLVNLMKISGEYRDFKDVLQVVVSHLLFNGSIRVERQKMERRAFGRIIGLVLRDGNPLHVLDSFLNKNASTLEDVLFFGDPIHVRAGVYDVFPENAFERIFSDASQISAYIHMIPGKPKLFVETVQFTKGFAFDFLS